MPLVIGTCESSLIGTESSFNQKTVEILIWPSGITTSASGNTGTLPFCMGNCILQLK
jgi:hypothetical protein